MFLSVITPTYNRGYILNECYKSLCKQTCRNFEWIIVDDGSTDDTHERVQDFISEGKIDIFYLRQDNGGKHRAHNTGVSVAQGELSVCLDSDDLFTEDAVEKVRKCWMSRKEFQVGILAKRGNMQDRSPICGTWPKELHSCRLTELVDAYGFYGDTVLFFDTKLLKKIPFKEFENERFLPEMNLYCDIDLYGEMILLDKVLYLCEYLPDGLTAKYHRLLEENPKGTADTYYKQMCMTHKLKNKFKYAVLAKIYESLADKQEELSFTKHPFILFVATFLAMIMKQHFLNKFKEGS